MFFLFSFYSLSYRFFKIAHDAARQGLTEGVRADPLANQGRANKNTG